MSKKRRGKQDQSPPERSRDSAGLSAQQRHQIVQAQVSASFSGPLPHPDILAQYNHAVPNGAERIIVMAEKQSEHRMALETQALTADIWRSYAGVGAGLLVAVLFLVASYDLIHDGHEWAGATVGGIDIASLVGVFVFGTISRRRERENRARWLAGDSRDD